MTRFFTESDNIKGDYIIMSNDDCAHLRSLRIKPSESFIICDGNGTDYICRLREKEDSSSDSAAQILEKMPTRGEPTTKITVFCALAKGDRLDYVVQKSVELGAYEIVLFPAMRCVAVPGDINKKLIRLNRISLEAAKQCGRGLIPNIKYIDSFEEAIKVASRNDLPLFFYECEKEHSLKAALNNASSKRYYTPGQSSDTISTISIVTGPEGGFEACEVRAAEQQGLQTVSLGHRILRSETAPIAALAAIMFYLDEM